MLFLLFSFSIFLLFPPLLPFFLYFYYSFLSAIFNFSPPIFILSLIILSFFFYFFLSFPFVHSFLIFTTIPSIHLLFCFLLSVICNPLVTFSLLFLILFYLVTSSSLLQPPMFFPSIFLIFLSFFPFSPVSTSHHFLLSLPLLCFNIPICIFSYLIYILFLLCLSSSTIFLHLYLFLTSYVESSILSELLYNDLLP